MGALAYLVGAIVVSGVATVVLVARHRRPPSMDAGMREFQRGLHALDPANDPHQRATGGGTGATGPRPARTSEESGPEARRAGGSGAG